jgi:catechol 2,3-dioxygenase-like lactoylglutathione lyase family enzyme
VTTLLGFDHVQLAMPAGAEAEASADRFYGTVLGLTRVAKPPALARRGGCWYEQGATRLHLGVEADFRPARKAHPALLVVALNELVARLQGEGYPWRWDDELAGVRRGFTDDPFGNRIELIEAEAGPPTA